MGLNTYNLSIVYTILETSLLVFSLGGLKCVKPYMLVYTAQVQGILICYLGQ